MKNNIPTVKVNPLWAIIYYMYQYLGTRWVGLADRVVFSILLIAKMRGANINWVIVTSPMWGFYILFNLVSSLHKYKHNKIMSELRGGSETFTIPVPDKGSENLKEIMKRSAKEYMDVMRENGRCDQFTQEVLEEVNRLIDKKFTKYKDIVDADDAILTMDEIVDEAVCNLVREEEEDDELE